ncbi:MAG: ABC transporter substrate-binding protein [Candidatus Omnitrophica bacterium]|nr:ABC transporter substrate-binding protein [Candidatus Omnitrophota bacterium]
MGVSLWQSFRSVSSWGLPLSMGLLLLSGCDKPQPRAMELRVGYFPNITHAQALIGLSNGAFQRALGEDAHIRPFALNAGPAAIEALFAGELDLVYIGPNPAINGFVKSHGQALRIVAGAASGGAVLVVREDSGITSVQDFPNRIIATPQLGNTQDIALRHYLRQHDLEATERGGTVRVTPMQNADILSGFLRKEIDAAWVPEPWGARLVHEAHGRILVDERDLWPTRQFPTAVVIVSAQALHDRQELILRWLRAHVELTRWIAAHPVDAKAMLNTELQRLTGKPIAAAVLDDAWSRLTVTYDPLATSLQACAQHAFTVGFLGASNPNLSGLVDATLLNTVLREQQLPDVSGS